MNARQVKKHLKKQIERLERKNKLLRNIIDDYPGMVELYNLYNRPVYVTHSTMSFQEYRVRRVIPRYVADDYHVRHALVGDLAEVIMKDIHFEPVEICGERAIEASIYIGRK